MIIPSTAPIAPIASSGLPDALTFLTTICGALKTIKRTGWVRSGIPRPESDADHMHRCAMCALLVTQSADPRDDYSSANKNDSFHPSLVDTSKLLKMAVTHDVCEALAGDITPHCDASKIAAKHETEDRAMLQIRQTVGDPLGLELYNLWREYEEQATVEAWYAKDIDKFEMVLQAFEYEQVHLKPSQTEPVTANSSSSDVPSATTTASTTSTTDDLLVLDAPLRGFFESTNSAMNTPMFRRLDAELRAKRQIMLERKGWTATDKEQQQQRDL